MDRAALDQVKTIVAHENCADGTASAILLHDALPQADVLFADYGRSADQLAVRPGMLFCDFSPPPARVDEFVAAGAIVLDHHRTARPLVERFGPLGVFADEAIDPGVSGAVLAFREVWLPLRGAGELRPFAERFAGAAGARDTWQTKHGLWREGSIQQAVLMTFPQRHWLSMPLSELARDWTERYAPLGEQVLVRKRARMLEAIEQGHRFTTAKGLRVLALNAPGVASDAAEELEKEVDLIAAFHLADDAGAAVLRLNLRSHAGFDCGRFALAHGGGGHTRAAGCSIRLENASPHPFRLLEILFANE